MTGSDTRNNPYVESAGAPDMLYKWAMHQGLPATTVKSWVKQAALNSFEEGVEDIGLLAFEGCKNLASIEIPSMVSKIGFAAFYGCKRLVSQILINNNVINERLSDICDCLTNVSNEDAIRRRGII